MAYHVHTIMKREYIEEDHTDDRKKIVNAVDGWLEVHKYGFAFFKTPKKARDAVESIHQSWLDGRQLRSYMAYNYRPEKAMTHKVKSGRRLRKPRKVAKQMLKKPAARKG